MKIRPLPDIDLARITSLPVGQQRKQLEQIRYGRPPFSYAPLRGCFHDIFNIQPEMFSTVKATDWAVIEAEMGRKCRSNDELQANLLVARGLYHFASEYRILGRSQEFFPLAMGTGQKVVYWLPMILSFRGQPLVPFIDPRQSRGLTREARRFVFSMMHERIRAADPDYQTVQFAIFQFGSVNGNLRNPVLHTDDGTTLFSFDQMEAMANTTYKLWHEVCEEREIDTRRKGDGTHGPLI